MRKKQFISWLLIICMVWSLMGTTFATDADSSSKQYSVTDTMQTDATILPMRDDMDSSTPAELPEEIELLTDDLSYKPWLDKNGNDTLAGDGPVTDETYSPRPGMMRAASTDTSRGSTTLSGSQSSFRTTSTCTITLNSVTIDKSSSISGEYPAIHVQSGTLTLNINGTCKLRAGGIAAGIQVDSGASVVINMNTNATLEVFGGTDQYRAGAGIGSPAQASATAGNITINSASGSTLCAHGGARPYYGAAGIGTGADAANYTKTITINAMSSSSSGTVNASGSFGAHVSAAGIGGGCNSVAPTSGGSINITGATVYAYATGQKDWSSSSSSWWHNLTLGGSTANGSAGIGSGGRNTSDGTGTVRGAVSKIYISGAANVTARGSAQGAGIGGGAGDHADDIRISGSATVDAQGSGYGAGIGGGNYGHGKNISISGTANVSANGSSYGAGIGGGHYGNGENITIQGSSTTSRPTVSAYAGSHGSGIGGGYYGGGFNIVINYANITDAYSYHGSGIGSGYGYNPSNSPSYGYPATITPTNLESGCQSNKMLTNIRITNSDISNCYSYYYGVAIGPGYNNSGSSNTDKACASVYIDNSSLSLKMGSYSSNSYNGSGIGISDSSYVNGYFRIQNCPSITIQGGGGAGTGIGIYGGSNNAMQLTMTNCAVVDISPHYGQNGFGCGDSSNSVFTANVSNVETFKTNNTHWSNYGYYSTGIGVNNSQNSNVSINFSGVKNLETSASAGSAIGISNNMSGATCNLTFTDCENITAKSGYYGVGIGAGYSTLNAGKNSGDVNIKFVRCPNITAAVENGDSTNTRYGAAIGFGWNSNNNDISIEMTDVVNLSAEGLTNYCTGIGTGTECRDNELHINIQPKSGVASSLTAGTQDYGVAIGTGYKNYDSSNSTTSATLTDIDIGAFNSISINNSGNDSVGIGVGMNTYSTSGQNVVTDIDIESPGKITMANVGVGIGLGQSVRDGVETNIDINHANGIDINALYTGIGMRNGCSNVADTNINLNDCGAIQITAPHVGIGSGYQCFGNCDTSITISDADSVSATVTDSNYATAIGSGYNNYANGGNPVLSVKLLRSGNITAKALGYGVAIGAGREGNGESVDILIENCGDVIANGNSNSSNGSYGIGMGVGYSYSGSGASYPVKIQVKNCASLIATGSRYSAGIGTSGNAFGDIALNISVTGTPTVTASARQDAPGIGVGYNNYNNGSKGTISITGATVTSTSGGAAGMGTGNNCRNGKLTLNMVNDTLRTSSSNGPALGLGKKNESSMTVNANLTNCTGTFNGTGYSAGIGQGLSNSNSVMNLMVSGGNITATGSKGGAGIGTGPVNAVCSFTLDAKNGAIINGTGSTSLEDELSVVGSTGNTILDNLAAGRVMGSGAGIGGSEGTQVISIDTNGVTLTGRGSCDGNYGSAGIGGGSNGNGGDISLTNTTTKAYGSDRGAGIGGGSRGIGGDVTISGGNTLVYGGKYDSAGIGGGNNAAEHGSLALVNNPTVTVYGCPNYQLAVPGEVTTNGVKFFQATLMEVPSTQTTFYTKDANERDVITITQPADYGAFTTTLSNAVSNGTNYHVYMDTTKNGSPITYQMATPYTVEDFPVVTSEQYPAELLTIIDFYTVKFDTDGGSAIADQTIRINNMVAIPETNPTKAGYKFAGWYIDPELTEIYDFSKIVTSDMTLYARWIDADKAVYCVQHWRQTLENTYILSSEQYLEGFVGETVSAEVIPAEGFTPINVEGTKLTGVLPATGTLKLALYYNRDMVTIEFKNVDSLVGQPEGVTKISAMYGSTVVLPKAEKAGWVFDYYTKNTEDGEQVTLLPNRIETFGNTLYANWTLKEGVKYTVCHYHQQLDGTYIEVLKEYFAAPKANATVTAERPDYPGFHVNTYITDGTGTGKASESGDTILRVYYDRNEITVNLIDGYGLPEDFVKRTSGEAANIPMPSRVGYRFDGWFKADGTKLPDTARIDDCGDELTAHWTAVPTTAYSVRYFLQTPGGAYKVDYIDDLQGETDSVVNAQIRVYDGYTVNTTRSKTSGKVAGDGSLTLYVYYDAKTYDISFNTNGGNTIAAQTGIPYGGLITRPADPVKQGYDFVGWYTDSGCNIPFSFNETVKGNMTLYAKWMPKGDTVYTVQYWFESDGGYEMRDEITLSGATGAKVEANVKYFPGYQESLTAPDRLTAGTIAADGSLVLKVYYDYQTATVEFDSNGGTEITKQTVKLNDYVDAPAIPVREGYTFVGWYSNASLTRVFDFEATPITKDITLYAKWTAKSDTQYTVKHYFEDSVVPGMYLELESISKTGTTGETAEAALLDKPGFHENRTHPDRHEVGTILADGSLVLKLYYARDIYTVDFVTNSESNIVSQNVRFEDKAVEPSAPQKPGFDFDGWFTDPELGNAYDFDTQVTGNLTLYAKWTAWDEVQYVTEYYQEQLDGSYLLFETVQDSAAAETEVNAVIKTYEGFNEASAHADRVVKGTLSAASALTLKVYYNRQTMRVSYETNSDEDVADQFVKYGAKAENISLTRDGYDFAGWFSNASLTKPYDFDVAVTQDITLYAKWNAWNAVEYTTEYYQETLDGGYTLVETVSGQDAVGTEVTAIVKDYPGFVENKVHTDRVVAGILTRESTLTLKVYYNRQMVQVRYESNGADDIADKSVKYGAKAEDVTLTRAGYTFNGWFSNASLTKPYDFDTPVTNTTILYAKWVANGDTLYTVQYYTECDTGYELKHEVQKTAATGETVFADIISITGYEYISGEDGEKLVGVVNENGTLVLKVYYKAVSHTVSFEVNGGSDVESIVVAHNGKITAPTTEREGYTFDGWYTNASLTRAFDFDSEIKRDTTLYAKWTSNGATNYTIQYFFETLDGGYDCKTETRVAATGDLVEAIPTEFDGFTYEVGNAENRLVGTVEADGSLILSIYYTRNEYVVTFDSAEGTEVDAQTVKFEGKATEPNIPSKEGYRFICWLDAADEVFDFSTAITSDVTLYAAWDSADNINYTVRHYFQNASRTGYVMDNDAAQILTGKVETEVTATPGTFYGFVENTEHENRVATGEIAPDGSLVLKLYYDRVEFTVAFESNGGSSVDSATAFYGNSITEPDAPEKIGYDFEGWFTDSVFANEFDFNSEINEDITLYAKWAPSDGVTYTVEFYQQMVDGLDYEKVSEVMMPGTTGENVEAVVSEIPEGFELNETAADAVMSGTVEADGSLVLKVYFDRLSYTLTFEPDNGDPTTFRTVRYGDMLGELPEITKTGFSFVDWVSDSGRAMFSDDTMPASDLTLTAKWNESFRTMYTTEYYHEQPDGTFALVETVELTGLTNSIVQAERYEYAGYTEDTTNFSRKIYGRVAPDGSLVLKVYYKLNVLTVAFESNGGTEFDVQNVKFGTSATMPTPVREGYEFKGWFENSNLTRAFDFAAPITKDVTLYAKWAANDATEYTIEYYLSNDDGTDYTLTESVTEYASSGEMVHARVLDFDGFHQNESHKDSKVIGTVAPDGSLVLKVYYDRNPFVITFDTNGGDVMEPVKVKFNKTLGNVKATKTGYVFVGWYTEAGLFHEYDVNAPVTNSMTLFAKWTPATDTKYIVQHYQQMTSLDGYTLKDTDILSGTTEDFVFADAKEYYGFYQSYPQDCIAGGNILPDGSLVLRLYYDRASFDVSFNTHGGSDIASVSVKYELPVTQPEAPTKVGYVFDGWFADDTYEVAYDFNQGIVADTEIHAKWAPATDTKYIVEHYQQTVDGTEYELFETDSLKGTTDEIATAIAHDYYGFEENVETELRIAEGAIAPDGSLVLKLYYDRLTYTVNFITNGGTVIAPLTVAYESTIKNPTVTKTGYDFAGWFKDSEFSEEFDFASTITEDTTLYVKWTPATNTAYTVEYFQQNLNGNGYTKVSTNRLTGTTGETVFADQTAPEGFVLNLDAEGTISSGEIRPNGTLRLALYFDRKAYTLTVNPDNGDEVTTKTVLFGNTIGTLPEVQKTGYTFTGWTTADGTTVTDATTMPARDLTVTAKWNRVSFGGGGFGGGSATTEIKDTETPLDTATPALTEDHIAYISGYPDRTIRPENNITRAEVAMIFYRLLTEQSKSIYETNDCSFEDVSDGAWYRTAVATLSNMGIISGKDSTHFDPDAFITRAEFAAIASRFSSLEHSGPDMFTDISDSWARADINNAAQLGWVKGYGDGTFRPNSQITRAEAIQMVNNVLQRSSIDEESFFADMIRWVDNADSSVWYYLAIQEATNAHDYDKDDNGHETWVR